MQQLKTYCTKNFLFISLLFLSVTAIYSCGSTEEKKESETTVAPANTVVDSNAINSADSVIIDTSKSEQNPPVRRDL